MAVSVFLDTSVLLAGLIDFGPQSAPAQSLLHAVAEKRAGDPATAWHCCLEFFSVATRLPPEFRVAPSDAALLIENEVFARMTVHDLPAGNRLPMLQAAAHDAIAGGRIYDAHIAEIARAAGAPWWSPTTAAIFSRPCGTASVSRRRRSSWPDSKEDADRGRRASRHLPVLRRNG